MGFLALLNHAINFMAPALWLAILMPLLAPFFGRNGVSSKTVIRQFAIHFGLGCVVLSAGLVAFGRDGKMLTYLALVLASATCQGFMLRGGRSH